MKLNNWSVVRSTNNEFIAPELAPICLQGFTCGHPKFDDDTPVITSRIIEIKDKGNHKEVITKSGSVYELYKEDVDSKCEKQFPNYYERLKLD